ncbi:Qat anti-phage system QueC-like protein QatC [Methylobacterium bullatum]|uniref:7-cyano-7-deazaguanine synthase n=1 Tax=Methylobacterium bullatum TaxID=570505 RepID=A0A679JBM0_9HYPH|nr:7-cyano-7-deazaguanine synthase [Methylobacterium bullatum]
MTSVVCHADAAHVPARRNPEDIHVVLYGAERLDDGIARIGAGIMDAASRFGFRVRSDAFDFMTLALAVTAADTFVLREEAEDRWCRRIDLTVPLSDPAPWRSVSTRLEEALRFLSGDSWSFSFVRQGPRPPSQAVVDGRRRRIDLSRSDCACLFSGGLDSYVGALDLIARGQRPLLVSHAYRGDRRYQDRIAHALPQACARFAANAHPTWSGPTDVSMRTRSFNFLAYGALAATALSQYRGDRTIDLWVPENGFIALNAPLTPRRIGAHSTRTTHPFFLGAMQEILDAVGVPVRIENALRHQTKGEMVRRHSGDAVFATMAMRTVSCGKWKRDGTQCGRCVPCLIRRASFHSADLADDTAYRCEDLVPVLADFKKRDDVAAVIAATRRVRTTALEPWVLQAGDLPEDQRERDGCVDVFRRGIRELDGFLQANGLV